MRTVVQKYGGSSLASIEQLYGVAARVARGRRAGDATVVVVSARGRTTDELLALAARLGAPGPGREVDQLLATGECASAALLALALQDIGVPAVSLTGPQAGIQASGRPGAGVVTAVQVERITRLLAAGTVAVVAGFQAVNEVGDVITLGRGGSDTTAVALAVGLGADSCAIYSDVDGVLTADPRVVPEARCHRELPALVTAELASAGARVLHPRCVELAEAHGLVVHVGHAASEGPGTVIRGRPIAMRGGVVGLAHDPDVARVLVRAPDSGRDLAADVLGVLGTHSVPADLVVRSDSDGGHRLGFTVRRDDLDQIRSPLRTVAGRFGRVRVDDDAATVSLVGVGLPGRPQYPARMMATLRGAGIATTALSVSQLRACVMTRRDRVEDAVRVLHREFTRELIESLGSAS
jgi:aspartate kinase